MNSQLDKRPSTKILVISEEVIRAMATAEPGGAAAKCIAEAEEMKARGKLYRFIFDGKCMGVQEGSVFQ